MINGDVKDELKKCIPNSDKYSVGTHWVSAIDRRRNACALRQNLSCQTYPGVSDGTISSRVQKPERFYLASYETEG